MTWNTFIGNLLSTRIFPQKHEITAQGKKERKKERKTS